METKSTTGTSVFGGCTLDQLSIEDERSFRHVGLYADLKEVLRRDGYRFRVLPPGGRGGSSWDRALLLNLTFWRAEDGGDVLVDETIPADVVAHVAWHHLAARQLVGSVKESAPSVQALFMGEAIASAFDLYLVGRLLGHAPESSFLATQVPAMTETAEGAGVSEQSFAVLLQEIADGPERAFADLRELLFDAANALFGSGDAAEAWTALARLDDHRFAALLHRYELSNWVLYARAYGQSDESTDARVRALDQTLRAEKDPLDWLENNWVQRA